MYRIKNSIHFDILSLFPGYFQGLLNESVISRAIKQGLIGIRLINIRDFANNKWKRVDDRPYGGGPGMVLMPEPVAKAIRKAKRDAVYLGHQPRVIYLSPQGSPLTAKKCRELAASPYLILLSGHYEGIDERVLELEVDEEISIGDYVLTNGCIAAIVLVDAVSRLVPGVLGDSESVEQDSFEDGLLDHPHFTRPEEFEGKKVHSVLLSGNHQKIAEWRFQARLEKTARVRPDLKKKFLLGENHE